MGRDLNQRPLEELWVDRNYIYRYCDKTTEMSGCSGAQCLLLVTRNSYKFLTRGLDYEKEELVQGTNYDLFCGVFDYLTLSGRNTN